MSELRNENGELLVGIELAKKSTVLKKNKDFISGLPKEDRKKYMKSYEKSKSEVLHLASRYCFCKISEYLLIETQEQVDCCNNLIMQHFTDIHRFSLNGLMSELDALLAKLREEYVPMWFASFAHGKN